MGGMLLFIFYGSILFFIVASVLRGVKYASAPLHLHWELYEGSSVYELTDWWTKTENTLGKKLRSMVWDILLLKQFYRRNRRFWYPLYAFHVGLYLLILWHAWLLISAVTVNAERASSFGWILGTFATVLTFVGGTGILLMRVRDADLKVYYPPIHYLKWLFILLTLAGGIYAVDVHFHSSMPSLLKYVREQVTFADFEHKLHPAVGPAVHVLFASAWLIYLPFSHVFQLFFRYYHHLRWDDVSNERGSEVERRVKELLKRPVTWSGPHIPAGKRWEEVATEDMK
jgi:nitrate reductase gamma subunit